MHELYILSKLNSLTKDKPFQSLVDRQKKKLGFDKLTILNTSLKADKTKVEDPIAALYGFYLLTKMYHKPMEQIFYTYLSDQIPKMETALEVFQDAAYQIDPDTTIRFDYSLLKERDQLFRSRLSEDL